MNRSLPLGTLAAFVLLQVYSLLLFYVLALAFQGLRGGTSGEFAMNVILLGTFVLLFPFFVFFESQFLSGLREKLNEAPSRAAGLTPLKGGALLILASLYVALLGWPQRLGLPQTKLWFALGYQAAHLVVADRLRILKVPKERMDRILSRESSGTIGSMTVVGIFLIGSAFIPGAPRWIFLSLGMSFLAIGLTILLVIADTPRGN